METYLIMVDVFINDVLRQNIFALKVPVSQGIPLAGDFIQIPEATAKEENIPIVLEVTSRRFILDSLILDRLSRDCNSCVILRTQIPAKIGSI
jgi:hypothetical protein